MLSTGEDVLRSPNATAATTNNEQRLRTRFTHSVTQGHTLAGTHISEAKHPWLRAQLCPTSPESEQTKDCAVFFWYFDTHTAIADTWFAPLNPSTRPKFQKHATKHKASAHKLRLLCDSRHDGDEESQSSPQNAAALVHTQKKKKTPKSCDCRLTFWRGLTWPG